MAVRQRFPLAVLIVDIDYFKQVNDSFGHQLGDAVIRRVSECLVSGLRDYDLKLHYAKKDQAATPEEFAGRYGGDEFAVAMPFCGEKEARQVAERLCEKVRRLVFEEAPGLIVTSSIGCAVLLDYRKCDSEHALVHAADDALYASKRGGRNQSHTVVLA